ncbi:MAG: carboxypeptidase-like regulatory domain-containing protein [Saprospiraceae bacterium]|nr:carboxypeptidase-like regulatory domain-containing protein [Saprospiraceae bacterium]
MKRLIIFCTFLAGLSSVANSQNLSVKGVVKDNEKNNLIGAVAVLLTPADSVMVSFGVTETDGSFLLSGIKAGKYTLQITYIGYGTLQRSLELLAERNY